MTGPVDWTVLLFIVSAVVFGVGFGWWIQAALSKARHDMRNEFHIMVADVDREREGIAREFAAYKLHVAETYMSKASGGMAIDRAVTEIKGLRNDLKEEMQKLGNRIERMENHALSAGKA